MFEGRARKIIYYQGFLLNRPLRELDAMAVFLKQTEQHGDCL